MRASATLLGLLLVACTPTSGNLLGEPDPESGVAPWEADITWEDCPLRSGGSGPPWASCALVEVPLDWESRDDGTIELFVKRYAEAGVDPLGTRDAVWPLTGGPGGAGNMQEGLAELLVANDPEMTWYLLDHRGTGRSERLGCSAEGQGSPGGFQITLDELPACADDLEQTWGDELLHFTTTAAATDLAWLVDATRGPDQMVHVHGGSYGTRWLQRFLQVAPATADSASGLGVVPPDFSFGDYDASYEATGAAYLELCGQDAECGQRLGPDPVARARDIMDSLDAGWCSEAQDLGVTREALRSFFGGLLLWGWNERVAIPALLHRVERCNGDDRQALAWFAANVPDPLAGLRNDRLFSRVLGDLIILSELWEEPGPTVSEAEQVVADGLFALGSSLRVASLVEADWPRYPEDGWAGQSPGVDIPLLWINGELDPATPLQPVLDYVPEAFDQLDQHLVVIPDGSHNWTSPTTDGYGCAMTVFWNFVRVPGEQIFECAELIQPTDLSGSPEIAWWLVGRDDLWGGPE